LTPAIYIIEGPTAAGKTDVAIQVAQQLGAPVISADSRQCYREMSIGVAKPTPEQLHRVKHYFIDTLSVTQPCSAADFEAAALTYLDEIFAANSTAVVCGGSGLYIKALCEGLDEMPATDLDIAQQAEASYKERGLAWLQQAVATEDPGFYGQGEVQNPARLLRALSFIRSTGSSITRYRTQASKQRPFRIFKAGLQLPREILYDRINARVDMMMAQGLLAEVEQLLPYRDLKPLQTVGYAELFAYIEGKCTLPDAVKNIKQHTRNYAKRQMTWFSKDKGITWFDADGPDVAEKILALGR
jgi:tRNA dimethylallyltransferase